MKQISLTQDKVALVDDADYEELSKHKWYALRHHSGNFYGVRHSTTVNGKRYLIRMSRQILGLEYRDLRQADHINHTTLDNRQVNLRICTNQENARNQKLQINTSSRFKGVCWRKDIKKWGAQIRINGETRNLGYWDMEEVAALRYDMAALREFGDYACLNFN